MSGLKVYLPLEEGFFMPNHEVFNQQAEVNSFQAHKLQLVAEHADWTQNQIDKQALVDFNTMMFPNQARTYLSEKRGDKLSQVKQQYRVIEGRLVDPFYGPFQKMIDNAATEQEKESLINFERSAVTALPGEVIYAFDTSGLGVGKGIKYMDTYEKNEQGEIVHKERIDLVGNERDLTLEEANVLWSEIDATSEVVVTSLTEKELPLVLFNSSIENRIDFLPELIQPQPFFF